MTRQTLLDWIANGVTEEAAIARSLRPPIDPLAYRAGVNDRIPEHFEWLRLRPQYGRLTEAEKSAFADLEERIIRLRARLTECRAWQAAGTLRLYAILRPGGVAELIPPGQSIGFDTHTGAIWFNEDPSRWFLMVEIEEAEALATQQASATAPPPKTEPKSVVVDLTTTPPSLPRYRVTKEFPQASQDDLDAAIAAVADADGGQTNRETIRQWARYWLREVRRRDISDATLEARWKDAIHNGRHRLPGRKPKSAN